MRIVAPTLAVFIVLASSALAGTPNSCGGMQARRLSFQAERTKLGFRAVLDAGSGVPSLAGGLTSDFTITLAYEPEADPANTVFTATIPAASFELVKGGARYRDRTGSLAGITLVTLKDGRAGTRKLAIKRKGSAIPATSAGTLRVVVTANGACSRSCPSACTLAGGKTKCARSTDTALCGVKSGCEVLNVSNGPHAGRSCLLPYPSSLFLKNDPSTVTGKRVAFPREVLPANAGGVHIDPAPWNQLDGFSPGPILTAYWPQGVDLAASNVPDPEHFADSLDPGSPTVLIEADSPGCVRVEHFGENDVSLAGAPLAPLAPPNQVFMVRPGRRLKNGTRYIAALRGFVGQDSQPIQPSTAFRALRDGTPSGSASLETRRPAFESIFAKLQNDCGVARANLVLAWDFTIASDDKLTRWLLHMRDQTFAQLPGSAAPAFVVSSVEDNPFPGDVPQRICRRVRGTYSVPLWTTFNGPGSLLNVDQVTDLPVQNGVATDVPFTASIPCSLTAPGTPGRAIFYGHGLLGSGNEVTAGNLRTLANTYGFVMAATDWQGFSNLDLPTIIGFLGDLSGFPKLPERSLQGVLNQLVLARLLKSPNGLASDPAFIYGGTPVIDTSDVFYYGISQGGIMGGIVMAVSQEATRGILGVPAANYSMLLHRSIDFDPYFAFLRNTYPDDIARNLTLPVIQQLWDRADPNGWYHHTIPGSLPNTPPHKVLVHMASSDDEVSNLGTEIMVRSMGIPQVAPVVQSYFGIPEWLAPFDGSAMVESDGGFPPEPITNIPPPDNTAHGDMRARPAIQAQIDQFLRTNGTVQNFCVGPCDPE